MGCWNGTCGLTGLPIGAGDEVIAFLIGITGRVHGVEEHPSGGTVNKANDASGFCETTGGGAFPISLPFFGEYNDYGGVDCISKGGFWLEGIRDLVAQDKKDMHIEDFICTEVERDNVFFKVEQTEKHDALRYTATDGISVGLFMVLKQAVDAAHDALRERTVRNPSKYRWGNFPTLEDFVAGGIQRYRRVGQKVNSKSAWLPYEAWGEVVERDYEKPEPLSNWVVKTLGYSMNEGPAGIYGSAYLKKLRPQVEAFAARGPEEPLLTELSELCFWFQVVHTAMAMTRGSWMPKSGKGSQMEDYLIYKAFAGVTHARAQQQKEKREEWGLRTDD